MEFPPTDFENPDNDDWAAVNQFTVRKGQHVRRPDILLFLNGLPIAGIELKNATDEQATIWTAYDQFQTYKHQIPSLYVHNALLAISDGLEARVGSLTSPPERFMPWRTIEGGKPALATIPQLRVAIEGLFDKQRLLEFLRYFIVFEEEKSGTVKKVAGYHQFHAVNRAIDCTVDAADARRPESCYDGQRNRSVEWQQHIRSKQRREAIAERFKSPKDPLKLVIVRDMWLTGFDVPCLHTMYVDKYIGLAKDLNEALRRGERLGLNDDELAFYDALEVNDSAVQVLGDACLRTIAKELVENVRKNTTIDWTQRENIQAKLRVIVKRILKKYGYPPDKQEKATQTVLEQAEVLSEGWAVAN